MRFSNIIPDLALALFGFSSISTSLVAPLTPLDTDVLAARTNSFDNPLDKRANCLGIYYTYTCVSDTKYTITGICGFIPQTKACTGTAFEGVSGPVYDRTAFNPCVGTVLVSTTSIAPTMSTPNSTIIPNSTVIPTVSITPTSTIEYTSPVSPMITVTSMDLAIPISTVTPPSTITSIEDAPTIVTEPVSSTMANIEGTVTSSNIQEYR